MQYLRPSGEKMYSEIASSVSTEVELSLSVKRLRRDESSVVTPAK